MMSWIASKIAIWLNLVATDVPNSCKVTKLAFKIASSDITCWKIVKTDVDPFCGVVKHVAPYVGKEYPITLGSGETISAEKEKPCITYDDKNKWFDLTSGFIHTLPYCPSREPFSQDYEVWKCIIPKGTLYIQANCRGSHYEANNSYASRKIQLIDKIF